MKKHVATAAWYAGNEVLLIAIESLRCAAR
jgi:hypothetical protein